MNNKRPRPGPEARRAARLGHPTRPTLVRRTGTTTCCDAYTSIDEHGIESCKACYTPVTLIDDESDAAVTAARPIDFTRYATQDAEPVANGAAVVPYLHRHPAPRRVTLGHQYLIRRLPNWRLTHWAIARVNRWLRRQGSSWQLWARPRVPRPGVRYGGHGKLAWADATRVSIFLKQRNRWQ